ncbi:MAG: [protein-PII] uridylyltransferase [Candidatus Sumerlaeia bacterium]|nr:[protein-PII] uridylyltransferase [Candidatus Sumerlaeia bacterium]
MTAPDQAQQQPGPEYTAGLRNLLEKAHKNLKENHLVKEGITTARVYSQEVEQILIGHVTEMAARQSCGHLGEGLALVAVGGFARCELGLHSDVDFCFLTADRAKPEEEEFIKCLLYPLWDMRLDLGYGVFSLKDCLDSLGNDITRATSLLEVRHLWGSEPLTEELQERVHGKLHKHHTLWLFESLHKEQESRYKRYGDTVFLLEPDVKNSCGCLRDIHQLLWIAFALFGESNLEVLERNGLVSESEKERIYKAWSFLIDLRNALHIQQGRRIDQLTLERQVAVARMMGMEQSESSLPEEQLMRVFFVHAEIVERVSNRLLKVALARTPGSAESQHQGEEPSQIGEFLRQGRRIWIEHRQFLALREDPYWPLRFFRTAAREGLEPADETIRYIEETIPYIKEDFRRSKRLCELFLGILRATSGTVAKVLRYMNRSGYLAACFPEFKSVHNLPRIDHYHQYTVDEHLVRSVGVSEQLISENPPEGMEHVAVVAREVLRIDLLNLALLFHDVGKGEGRAHVIRGAHAVKRICERLGMRLIEQEVVRSLVANHQKITHMALRRDIEDPSIALELAEAVRDPEDLKMLYVHSACDLRAVSEESWNEWRGRLMAILFTRAMEHLRGIKSTPPVRPPTAHLAEQIWQELHKLPEGAGYTRGDLDGFLIDMPDRYVRSAPAQDIVKHFLLTSRLDSGNRLHWRVDNHEGSSYVEITFVAQDAPGLFSNLCLGLTSRKYNILSAQIYTASSGTAIDIFQVDAPSTLTEDIERQVGSICAKVNKFITGGPEPDWKIAERNLGNVVITRERLDRRPPRVDIHNNMSPSHTVIEVRAPDRPGLLGEISTIFDRFSCNIDLAFVSTESYQVVDVFYVTDLETNKIAETGKLKSLREALMEVIQIDAEADNTRVV